MKANYYRVSSQGDNGTNEKVFPHSEEEIQSVIDGMNESMIDLYRNEIDVEPYLSAVALLTELKQI